MLAALADMQLADIKKRHSEGDCPTIPALSTEWLEDMVLHYAARAHEAEAALATTQAPAEPSQGKFSTEDVYRALGKLRADSPAEPSQGAEERLARKMAAEKMGLVKDTEGARLPDDLWQQCLPAARASLSQSAGGR